ncbi:MAG: 4'-phosphopantetheinyl transferase superfamily protein [Bacteroidota bacterium]
MEIDFGLSKIYFEQYFTEEFSNEEVLTSNEKLLVKEVSEKRIRDFSTGRQCARKVLGKFGDFNSEILIGSKKEPLWPKGFVGSISHSKSFVGAVVSKSSQLVSIGLDIEKTGRVKKNMWRNLFTPIEQEFLNTLSEEDELFYTTLFFSMKESFYKLQYPITKQYLWFTDVELKQNNGVFNLAVIKEFNGKALLPEFTDINYARHNDNVISVCFIE